MLGFGLSATRNKKPTHRSTERSWRLARWSAHPLHITSLFVLWRHDDGERYTTFTNIFSLIVLTVRMWSDRPRGIAVQKSPSLTVVESWLPTVVSMVMLAVSKTI
jgi:hypothetical protein